MAAVKHEIDLVALFQDINEDTFKPKQSVSKGALINQNKKKVQGTGQFCLTTTTAAVTPSQAPHSGNNNQKQLLRPKINQKYNVTPSMNGAGGIAGFMGLKRSPSQEEEEQPEIKVESPLIVKQDQQPAPVESATQSVNVKQQPKKGKGNLSVAEYACGFSNADDFFQNPIKQEDPDVAMQESTQGEDYVPKAAVVAKKPQPKKRGKQDITKEEQHLKDEVDEYPLADDQMTKRRKINPHPLNVEDQL